MRQPLAGAHIRTARANIRRAIQICGTADLARLQRALNLLQATVTEMHLAEAAIRSGNLNERAELQREAALLKREVACLMRSIDGCAALHRGLGIRLGCTALTYSREGRSVVASRAATACEMQG